MSADLILDGIWFVYDGDCPLCTSAALALRIKQQYGKLNLLNARDAVNHPLLNEINKHKLDLDEGMVIYHAGRFYHGREALTFMARFSENKGLFNIANKILYWSDSIAYITYPWLRGARNALLRNKSASRIDNLNLKNTPIFKSVFGQQWNELPPVIKKHYANRPYTDDDCEAEGTLDVRCSGIIKWFSWIFWLMKGIPPHNENDVPVTVHFRSEKNTQCFHFDRIFHFKSRKPYRFHSNMTLTKDNEVVEVMRSRLGWKMNFLFEDGLVKLKHKGYVLRAFGHFIPLPLTCLLGKGDAVEQALDDNTFTVSVALTHPLWGEMYAYQGVFKIKQ